MTLGLRTAVPDGELLSRIAVGACRIAGDAVGWTRGSRHQRRLVLEASLPEAVERASGQQLEVLQTPTHYLCRNVERVRHGHQASNSEPVEGIPQVLKTPAYRGSRHEECVREDIREPLFVRRSVPFGVHYVAEGSVRDEVTEFMRRGSWHGVPRNGARSAECRHRLRGHIQILLKSLGVTLVQRCGNRLHPLATPLGWE